MKRYDAEELVSRTLLTTYEGGEPVDHPVRVVAFQHQANLHIGASTPYAEYTRIANQAQSFLDGMK